MGNIINQLQGIISNAINKANQRKSPVQTQQDNAKNDRIAANQRKRAKENQEAKARANASVGGYGPNTGVLLQNVQFVNNNTTNLGMRNPEVERQQALARQYAQDLVSGRVAQMLHSGTNVGGQMNYGSEGGFELSDTSEGGVFGEGSTPTDNPVVSSMTESEVKYFENMKDSNVPYYYEKDEHDLMYLAASEQRDNYWGLKEEMFLYTIHDRLKHRYITDIQIDSDASDIVTTCTVHMPYRTELIEYYIPGKTAFMVIGGTFDREVLFIGRVSEANQIGDTLEVIAQNIGWKFKQYIPTKFYEKIQAQPVPIVVKAIFKELGFEEGKYHIDLWAIPDVFKYKLDENATIKFDGETVENIPELKDVVKRMQESDINKYVATKAKLRETKEVAADYDKHVELSKLNSVVQASNQYYPSFYRKNYGVKTTLTENGLSYDPLEDRIYGTNKTLDYFTQDRHGDSDYTYEDVLSSIASAIDAQFFIIDTTVCFVSFNALMTMKSSEAIAKSIQPRIEFWQLEEDSFELDINQYGYYNTVIINYKNGTLKRAYDDLVRVYGEIAVTYDEKELNYEAAQLKAQAYLSAHIRDFGMEVKIRILYTGKISVSNFIKVQNPLTMSESLFYVYGTSISWDASNQTLMCDLDLRYGPENPDDLEVPEYGLTYSGGSGNVNITGDVPADVTAAAKQMIGNYTNNDDKVLAIYNWVDQNVEYQLYWGSNYTSSEVLTGKRANCWDTAYLIYNLCTAVGIKCEVYNGYYHFLDGNWGHLWNKIYYKGKMTFADTGRKGKNPIGQHGDGRYIVSESCVAKNY